MGLTPSSSRWNHNSTLLCRLPFHSGRWGELTFLYCKHGCRNPTWRLGGVSASISRVSTRNTAHEGWRRAHARFRDRTEWTASWVDSVVSLVRLPRACTTTTGRARFGGYRPRDRGTCQDGCGIGANCHPRVPQANRVYRCERQSRTYRSGRGQPQIVACLQEGGVQSDENGSTRGRGLQKECCADGSHIGLHYLPACLELAAPRRCAGLKSRASALRNSQFRRGSQGKARLPDWPDSRPGYARQTVKMHTRKSRPRGTFELSRPFGCPYKSYCKVE